MGQFPAEETDFSLLKNVHAGSEALLSPIQQLPGTLLLQIKWAGHKADPSLPSSTKAKEEFSYTPHVPISHHSTQSNNYTFY
jgi:hypothetical protein